MNSNNIILLGLAVFCTGEIWGMEQGCCESKTVGSNSYTLVENETASEDLGCNSLCVYKMDGKPESRYCHADERGLVAVLRGIHFNLHVLLILYGVKTCFATKLNFQLYHLVTMI